MSEKPNYFAPPSTSFKTEVLIAEGDSPSAREIFLAWERLRLVYNAILIAETLLAGWPLRNDRVFHVEVIVGAILANVAFCAGPVGEGYLDWLGLRRPIGRAILMTGGTILAMMAALLVISSRFLDDF